MAVLFYVSVLAMLHSVCCAREYKAYGAMKNVALKHVFQTTRVATDMDCCNTCSANASCVAANYERSTGTCELNDKHPRMEAAGVTVQKEGATTKTLFFLTAGCRAGWTAFRGDCYQYNPDWMSWSASEAHCVTLGAHLVDIADAEELDFVGGLFSDSIWIGMSDLWSDTNKRWSSGRLVEFSNFGGGEPNCYFEVNSGVCAEDCVEMHSNNKWNDIWCWNDRPSVCKKPCFMP